MRYYHVAGEQWQAGDDLLSFDRLADLGIDVTWKWDDAEAGFDGDVVCIFETRTEADEYQGEHGGTVLVVDIPDNELTDAQYMAASRARCLRADRLWTRRVDEGYLAVVNGIPAEWLTVA